MTRSGRFYEAADKGKGVVEEKKKVEDVMLRQLKKIPAQVSIWELLCLSQEYGKAMVEALGRIIVPADAEPVEVIGSVQKQDKQALIFTEEELPKEGRGHKRALFIRAEVKGKKTSCVMVDDGSSINVFPLKIMPKLSCN